MCVWCACVCMLCVGCFADVMRYCGACVHGVRVVCVFCVWAALRMVCVAYGVYAACFVCMLY